MRRRVGRWYLACTAAAVLTSPAGAQVTSSLPLGVGIRTPSYDRADGVSVPVGPVVRVGEIARIDPTVTYRSHIGAFDPELAVRISRRDSVLALEFRAGRGTFTNDGWIRGDLINSLAVLVSGRDARNYYRADRFDGRIVVAHDAAGGYTELFVGARNERAWSTGWRTGERHGPFAFGGRRDARDGVQRPNPSVISGRLRSALAGVRGTLDGPAAAGSASLVAERGTLEGHAAFTQLTAGVRGVLESWHGERLVLRAHAVVTPAGVAPPQRWAYVGGSGTLPTAHMLERGGDHMFFADGWYEIPLPWLDLPLVGPPFIAPRAAAGAAGVRGFGTPIRNIGVRLGAAIFRADIVFDPVSHRHALSLGVSLDD